MVSWRATICFVLAGLVTSAVTASAQTDESGKSPLSGAIGMLWQGARLNIQESAAQIPEGDYSFRPTLEVRTFGQMLAHIAGANYVFCAAAKGERSPHAEDEFEKTATTKTTIVEALEQSLAYCDTAYDTLTDATAVQLVTLPFGGGLDRLDSASSRLCVPLRDGGADLLARARRIPEGAEVALATQA